jgi:hypothetical protein
MPNNWKGESGFTRAEAVVLIGVLIFVTVGVFLPYLAKAKAKASRINGGHNLKNVGLAFRVFAIDNHDFFPMALSTNEGGTKEIIETGAVFRHFQALSNELATPKILVCPMDADRWTKQATSFVNNFSDANISYFVGLDASETNGVSILSGDRNLEGGTEVGKRIFAFTNPNTARWGPRIHENNGCLCYGDGSVMGLSNGRLASYFEIPSNAAIRLAIPP